MLAAQFECPAFFQITQRYEDTRFRWILNALGITTVTAAIDDHADNRLYALQSIAPPEISAKIELMKLLAQVSGRPTDQDTPEMVAYETAETDFQHEASSKFGELDHYKLFTAGSGYLWLSQGTQLIAGITLKAELGPSTPIIFKERHDLLGSGERNKPMAVVPKDISTMHDAVLQLDLVARALAVEA